MSLSAANAVTASVVGAVAAQVAAPVEPALASLWSVTVMGIPLGVLAASMAGSSARALRDPASEDRKLAQNAIYTVIDGLIGGWGAMFLFTFSYSRNYFVGVEPAILGAFGGLLTEWVRTNGPRWFDLLWKAVTSRIAKTDDFPPDAPTKEPPP